MPSIRVLCQVARQFPEAGVLVGASFRIETEVATQDAGDDPVYKWEGLPQGENGHCMGCIRTYAGQLK